MTAHRTDQRRDLPDDPHQPAGRAEATRQAAQIYQELAAPFTLRTRDQIAGLFTGLDLVDPGLVLTEAMKIQGLTDDLVKNFGGAPPEVAAEVIAWLATDR